MGFYDNVEIDEVVISNKTFLEMCPQAMIAVAVKEKDSARGNRFPSMSWQEKIERRQKKINATLDFVADEKVATAANIAGLLRVGEDTASNLLKVMESQKLLDSAKKFIRGRPTTIYCVTSHGLAVAGRDDVKRKAPSSFHENFLPHRLQLQSMRILAERRGFTCFTWRNAEFFIRQIEQQNLPAKVKAARLKKIPDALMEMKKDGKVHRFAIELENSVKSKSRFSIAIMNHIQSIKDGNYDVVVYYCPEELVSRLTAALMRIPQIQHQIPSNKWGEKYHVERFAVRPLSSFLGAGKDAANLAFLSRYKS